MNLALLTSAARLRSNLICSRAWPLAVALAVACSFPIATAASTYPVVDAGYRLARHGKLYWLDDERVLFYGGNAEQGTKRAGARNTIAPAGGTYVWNIATGSLEHVSEWEITCYHPEYSTWSLKRPEKNEFRFKAGKFGHETELPSEKLTVQQRMQRVRSDMTCKTYLRSELLPPPPLGHRIIVLHEGDGYLDVGPLDTKELRDQRSKPILLLHPGRSSPIELPMKLEQGVGNPSYSAHLGAYVSRPRPKGSDPGHVTSWPRGLPFTIYTFKATGEASEFTVPYGEWGTASEVRPTRAGWIFSGHGVRRAHAGLFLFQNSSVRRLDAGQVHGITVSNNGCLAAVAIQNRHLEMGAPINLKVVELCSNKR